jgi:hypothetical protein
MNASDHALNVLTATVRVGKFTCTFTARSDAVSGVSCEWEPDVPDARKMKARDLAAYIAGRDAFIAELAAARCLRIAVVDERRSGLCVTVPTRPQCEGRT